MIFLFGDGKLSTSTQVSGTGELQNLNWISVFIEALVSLGYNVNGLLVITPRGTSVKVSYIEGKVEYS
jgi:hypothetical protein